MSGPREIILHVGPSKTATTTIQRALVQASLNLEPAGVRVYTERWWLIRKLVQEQAGFVNTSNVDYWSRLLDPLVESGPSRVIFSNELLSWFDERSIGKIVNALGPSRVRVVIGVRPLAEIIPSYWQEYLKSGLTVDYEQFHQSVLGSQHVSHAAKQLTDQFWVEEHLGNLADRWIAHLGKDRVTGFVVDVRQPALTVERAAQALSIQGLISSSDQREENRSLGVRACATMIECNRRFNRRGLSPRVQKLLQITLSDHLRANHPDDMKLPSLEEYAATIAIKQREIDAQLNASGIVIIGRGDPVGRAVAPPPIPASSIDWRPWPVSWLDVGRRLAVHFVKQQVHQYRNRRSFRRTK